MNYSSLTKTFTEKIGAADICIGDVLRSDQLCAHTELAFWGGEDRITLEVLGVTGQPDLAKSIDGDAVLPTDFGKIIWRRDAANPILLRKMFVWNSKPKSNVLIMQLGGGWRNFNFFYQTPFASPTLFVGPDGEEWLHQDEGRGNYSDRPRSVDGSYAVYHKTKRNHRIGGTN